MVAMLGAFVMLGIQPGPEMAVNQLGLVWTLIWTLVIANVLAALLFLAIGRWLALVPFIKPGRLVPFVLLLTFVVAYLASTNWQNLVLLTAFGFLGHGFKQYEWPRPPFVIGLTLGPVMDISLHQALAIWGWAFVFRPLALCLALATVATAVISVRSARSKTRVEHAAV